MDSIVMLAKYTLILLCFGIVPIYSFVVLYKKVLRKFIVKEKDALGYTKFLLGKNYEPTEDYKKTSRYILVFITFIVYYAFYGAIMGILYTEFIEKHLK